MLALERHVSEKWLLMYAKRWLTAPEESQEVLSAIKERISACELKLNEEKTKIVYCKTANRKLKFKTVKFD